MSALRPLVAEGKGSIAVILPDTGTAGHFAEFDAPDLKKSFQLAGLGTGQYTVQTALGGDMLRAAKSAIANGASVLIVDTRYSGFNVSIESYANAHGVPVIDYVPLYVQGYDAVLARQFSRGWTEVGNPAGTWDPLIALSEFQQQYPAHQNINAALTPNDTNAAAIIGYLQSKGVKPRTFPTTGLDAAIGGLRNILAGYQCGTVYKPIYLEAQAAAALAMYLRAGVKPPASLLNWHAADPQANTSVAAVLLTPQWVTAENMNATVIADQYVSAARLCSATYILACTAAGIRSY